MDNLKENDLVRFWDTDKNKVAWAVCGNPAHSIDSRRMKLYRINQPNPPYGIMAIQNIIVEKKKY